MPCDTATTGTPPGTTPSSSRRARPPKTFEALLAQYLVALLDADRDAATTHLREIANTWTSTPWSRTQRDPLHRVLSLQLHGYAALGERVLPGVAEVASGTPAWSAEFAALVRARSATASRRSVVDLPGVTASLGSILSERPFADRAARHP